MSDAAEQVDDEVVDPPKGDPEPTMEEQAAEQGHKSKEDWVAAGNDAKDWRSAEVFIARGEWIEEHKAQNKRIDEIEAGFNTRLGNVKKLYQGQLETQKADLIRKRDEAIELADKDKALSYQGDIDNLGNQTVDDPKSGDQAVLDAWNGANPWILEATPKAAYAVMRFQSYQGQGQTAKQAIANTEADVSREFPAINPNRETHPTPEGGSRPGKKRGGKKLTMADITPEERKYRAATPTAWKTDKEFLQAVEDSRSES